MPTHFSATCPPGSGAAACAVPLSSVSAWTALEDTGRGDEKEPFSNGWYDSSFDLRRGLEVTEWVLADFPSGKR